MMSMISKMRSVRVSRVAMIAGVVGAMSAAGCLSEPDPAASEDPTTGAAVSELAATDMISALNFVLTTGGDDKRSDSHVFVQVRLTNQTSFTQEAGLGQTWSNNSTHTQQVALPFGTLNSAIAGVRVFWQQGPGGGFNSPDNWNLQQLQIQAVDATLGGFVSTQVSLAGNPLVRFTGSTTNFTPIYNH
jgi:hypothetical protein